MSVDYLSILSRMLGEVPNTLDKRPGSIIYDALAPAAAELAKTYIDLEIWKEQTYLLTATGVNLDNRGGDFAIERLQATNALRIAKIYNLDLNPIDIEIGHRFATPSERGGLIYKAVERIQQGEYILESETPGSVGNEYLGVILPLFNRNNLGRAEIIGTQVPARDIETDDDYRKRIKERMFSKAFGGNIADYKRFTKEITGVGDLKVYPVWDGGGTVRLSVVDSNYDSISPEFIQIIKNTIDPEEETGLGVGIAPIGHVVTVSTPTQLTIDIEANVTLDNHTTGQIQPIAENNIRQYFAQVRRNWADNDVVNVFNIQVANAILNIEGVVNVTNVRLNGYEGDLVMTNTPRLQQLPYLGKVTLYEP